MMRELDLKEIEHVNGGGFGFWGGMAASWLIDSAIRGYTGKGVTDWLSPAFVPVSPHVAYYDRNMYFSP